MFKYGAWFSGSMDIKYLPQKIELTKELNSIDRLAADFTEILNELGIKYAVVAGCVAILFGRNRASEDVDIILEKTNFKLFTELWNKLSKNFECIITHDTKEAYDMYLMENTPIRFSRKGEFIPNVEIKFPKLDLDYWTIANRKKVIVNGRVLFIGPIELEIPYKLFMGSGKDIEDAKHLYNLFKEKLNLDLLAQFNRKFKIEKMFNKYLK